MSDKERLIDLIEKAKQPSIIEWVFEVEDFLKSNNELTDEAEGLIEHIKIHKNALGRCDNLLALLKMLLKKKYERIEIPPITKRNQIFVAMRFSDDLKTFYNDGYKTVIQSLNYSAMRIDEKDFTGSIISEITKEIPNSVALIADLTGNRGGVYYEAGIARGLQLCKHPIELVLTCHKEFFDNEKVHFDVSGDNILLYNNVEDLVAKLTKRLRVVLK